VKTSLSQKSKVSRKADHNSEIINVPMPRAMAKRLMKLSYSLLESNCNYAGISLNSSREKLIAAVSSGAASYDEYTEVNAKAVEEYRIFEKALAAGGAQEVAHV